GRRRAYPSATLDKKSVFSCSPSPRSDLGDLANACLQTRHGRKRVLRTISRRSWQCKLVASTHLYAWIPLIPATWRIARPDSGGAFSFEDFRREFARFTEVHEISRRRVGFGKRLEVREHGLRPRNLDAGEKRRCRLSVLALAPIEGDKALHRFGNSPRGDFRGEPSEGGAAIDHAAADHR